MCLKFQEGGGEGGGGAYHSGSSEGLEGSEHSEGSENCLSILVTRSRAGGGREGGG